MWRLLLADVFEQFRNNSLKNYWLCPSHYLSVTSLNWDAMLNMTKVELDLIADPHMYIWPKIRMKTYYILRREELYKLAITDIDVKYATEIYDYVKLHVFLEREILKLLRNSL